MHNQIYVIYDTVACESGPCFEAKNSGVALRQYEQLITKQGFRDEYDLMLVGEINHETNIITSFEPTKVQVEFGDPNE